MLTNLAANLEKSWAQSAYDQDTFAPLAAEMLSEWSDEEAVTLAEDAISALLSPQNSSLNMDPHLSEGITPVFDGAYFKIFLHRWTNAVATPHQHDWSGAYRVLRGRSLHTEYKFNCEINYSGALKIGSLRSDKNELLAPGAVKGVCAGSNFIHGLSYADDPGLAISIRATRLSSTPMDFRRPGVGYDHLLYAPKISDAVAKSAQIAANALASLYALQPKKFLDSLINLIRTRDPRSAYLIANHFHNAGMVDADELADALSARFGVETAQILIQSFVEDTRAQLVAELRDNVSDPAQRHFIGALHAASDFTELKEMVRLFDAERDTTVQIGGSIVGLLTDNDEENETPHHMAEAFGRFAAEPKEQEIICWLKENHSDKPHIEHHLEFFVEATAAMREAPLYAPLFRQS